MTPPEDKYADEEGTHRRQFRSRSLSRRGLHTVLEGEDDEQSEDATTRTLNVMANIDLKGPDEGVGGESLLPVHRAHRNRFLQYVQQHSLQPGTVGDKISLNFPEYITHKISMPAVMVNMEVRLWYLPSSL